MTMKNTSANNLIKSWIGILSFSLLLLMGACNGQNETDYVNEIEKAENAVGDPVDNAENTEPGDGAEVGPSPADVETDSIESPNADRVYE